MGSQFKGDDNRISYIEKGNKDSQTIILFPAGPGDSGYFLNLMDKLSYNYHLISLDLPGMGKTEFRSNDCKDIAEGISSFIKAKKINDPILIGESFGGTIIIELNRLFNSRKNILIGSGEYFTIIEKVILTLIFLPPRLIIPLQRIYAKIISHLMPTILYIKDRTDEQLRLLSSRWNKILWYRLPDYFSDVSTLIILGTRDKILNPKSSDRLRSIYRDLNIIKIDSDHFSYQEILKNQDFDIIEKFISS